MSAQLYLSRLVEDGRHDRAHHRAPQRTGGLARLEQRVRRALELRKH
jgi:hypothetical protein